MKKSSYQKRKDEIEELKKDIKRLRSIERAFRDYLRADLEGDRRKDVKERAKNTFKNHASNDYYLTEIEKTFDR